MTEKNTPVDVLRTNVSKAYAASLSKVKQNKGSCCSPSGCCTSSQLAGYGVEAAAYEQAAQSSFGCGNPLAFANVQQGETVLDLGAGAGFDLLIASDKVGAKGRVIGVDMTDDMLEAAQQNAERAGKNNIELRKGCIEELPVKDACVDWVISNCVINLSPDKPAVFREIARVLKPGGAISISDIVAETLPPIVQETPDAYYACIGGAIPESDYIQGLKEAGLDDVAVTQRIVYTAAQLAEMMAGSSSLPALMRELDNCAGAIWSARFEARKPLDE